MPARFAIFAATVVGIGSLSGVSLGSFATTTRPAAVDATDIHELSGQIGDTSSQYGPAYPTETVSTDMAPDHIPVCRKGCGPTLADRQNGSYFDSGSPQLDRIYGANEDHYASDPQPVVTDPSTRPAMAVTLEKPRVVYGTPDAQCRDGSDPACETGVPAQFK